MLELAPCMCLRRQSECAYIAVRAYQLTFCIVARGNGKLRQQGRGMCSIGRCVFVVLPLVAVTAHGRMGAHIL